VPEEISVISSNSQGELIYETPKQTLTFPETEDDNDDDYDDNVINKDAEPSHWENVGTIVFVTQCRTSTIKPITIFMMFLNRRFEGTCRQRWRYHN